jgi:hypothetical protein
MARSTCVKCGNGKFETMQHSPSGSRFKLVFIQCSSCGGVVGVVDFYNIGDRLTELGKKLGVTLSE